MEENEKVAINGCGDRLLSELTGETFATKPDMPESDRSLDTVAKNLMKTLYTVNCKALKERAVKYTQETKDNFPAGEASDGVVDLLHTVESLATMLIGEKYNAVSELLLIIGIEYMQDSLVLDDIKQCLMDRSLGKE